MMSMLLVAAVMALAVPARQDRTPAAHWQANVGQTGVKVYRVQVEEGPDRTGGYDWGACVMKDGSLYRMWWTRPCAQTDKTLAFETTGDSGKPVKFEYSTRGDRIFYAESRDGYTWRLNGSGDEIELDAYGPDSSTPVIVLRPSETKWERRHVGCPSVVKVDGTFYMYYEAPPARKLSLRTHARSIVRSGTQAVLRRGSVERPR